MEDIHQPDGGTLTVVEVPLPVTSTDTVGSKRQRRPSVRLGEIGGEQPYDSLVRRPSSSSAAAPASKQWKQQSNIPLNPSLASASVKSSKTRAVTNLSTDFIVSNETLYDERDAHEGNKNLDGVSIGSWKVKDFTKRGPATKRVRSNWVSKPDDNDNTNNSNVETEDKFSGSKDNEDFDVDNSESPMKEQSPIHSLDNLGIDGVELSGPSESDTDTRGRCEEDVVKIWLNSLGLGRYAPVFEIHEVDDEVLPLLTLEDLKDMGINAVGSRRKMFCAIQKLSKGFS